MKDRRILDESDPKPEIRRNAENASDWAYREEAEYLYEMANLFKDRFLDPILHTDRGRLPDPIISFDDLRNKKTLAAYTLHRNASGLLDEITFNTAHYVEQEGKRVWAWGRWAQLETLLHEQVHLWQENFGEYKHKPGRVAHDKEFVDKCESLGLHPMPVVGCHTQVADGVFHKLMDELGIPRPDDVPRADPKRDWFRPNPEKGRSTLHKWVCPDCGLSFRLGINGDPMLVHDVCSEIKGEKVFLVRHDGLEHVIYEGEENDKDPLKIITDINETLNDYRFEDGEELSVENIAEKIGISRNILYEWVQTDSEFSYALERLKKVQENDPFKTGTREDYLVNGMMIALLLVETRDRHYKSQNQ